jgi:hypothetical protein
VGKSRKSWVSRWVWVGRFVRVNGWKTGLGFRGYGTLRMHNSKYLTFIAPEYSSIFAAAIRLVVHAMQR